MNELYGLLGINPEELRRQQMQQGLLGAGLQMLAASGPSAMPTSLGQIVAQGGAAGLQGYQQAEQSAIDRALQSMQVQRAAQQAEAQKRQQQFVEQYAQTLPEDQRAKFMAFPEKAAEAMFREPGETFRPLSSQEAAQLGLPPNVSFQISSKGKISQVGQTPAAVVNVGGKASPFEEASQKKQAEVFSNLQESGSQAARSLQSVEKLDKILGRIETGGVAAFKQVAGNFGVATKGLNDIQAAQAIINKLVPEQRPPGSGTMSDADLALYKESLPRIINQPGANKLIVQSMKDINSYLVKEGQIASDVLDGKITPAEGRRKLLELGNPIQDFFNQNPSLAPQAGGIGSDLQNAAMRELERRRGGR